jgi:hypothetical protein
MFVASVADASILCGSGNEQTFRFCSYSTTSSVTDHRDFRSDLETIPKSKCPDNKPGLNKLSAKFFQYFFIEIFSKKLSRELLKSYTDFYSIYYISSH